MKLFDNVKVIRNSKDYGAENIYKGRVGTIIDACLIFNSFQVSFSNDDWDELVRLYGGDAGEYANGDTVIYIQAEDLEVVEESDVTDEYIQRNLPNEDPKLWCKVENGYIYNLLGEVQNPVQYKYR